MSKRVQARTLIGSPGCPVSVALLAHPCGHHETAWGVHGKPASRQTSAGCPYCVWKTWKSCVGDQVKLYMDSWAAENSLPGYSGLAKKTQEKALGWSCAGETV